MYHVPCSRDPESLYVPSAVLRIYSPVYRPDHFLVASVLDRQRFQYMDSSDIRVELLNTLKQTMCDRFVAMHFSEPSPNGSSCYGVVFHLFVVEYVDQDRVFRRTRHVSFD